MIEYLVALDIEAFKILNGAFNPFLDHFMWLVSGKFAWILMCIALLYVVFRNNWKNGVVSLLFIALTITLCDQISSTFIKHTVERLRPTHTEALMPLVHTVNGYVGGLYGFVSSHAANSFGVAMFLALMFKQRLFSLLIFLWAVVLSYSRIYLGVHFPGDILGGAIVGLLVGYLVYFIYIKLRATKYGIYVNIDKTTELQLKIINISICMNMCILLLVSAVMYFMG